MADEKEMQPLPWGQRLRRAALFVLFSAVLLIPKTLALRRRRRLWMILRFGAAVVGAGLVLATGGAWGWLSGLGVALLFLALLARPMKEGRSVDAQAHELGALVVVNGGRLRTAAGYSSPTRLYVTPERVHVLDLEHRLLLEISLSAISVVRAEELREAEEAEEAQEAQEGWRLVVEWDGQRAVFRYEGFFAEHLARVAETTLTNQRRAELPVLK